MRISVITISVLLLCLPVFAADRPATANDLEKTEKRCTDYGESLGRRIDIQWQVIGKNGDSITSLDKRIVSLETDREHSKNTFTWTMSLIGTLVATSIASIAAVLWKKKGKTP